MPRLRVFGGFLLYILLVVLFGPYWRRRGFQSLEYIAGAVIVIEGARAELAERPGDWYTVVRRNYLIALATVGPMELGLALWDRWQAEKLRREDEAR